MSLKAYHDARSITEQPRAIEQRLMTEITKGMVSARQNGLRDTRLMPVLHRNREAWGVFSAACATQGNLLPNDLRARIISLSLWVDKFTSEVIAGRESINDLIDVNVAVIEGLSPNRAAAPS